MPKINNIIFVVFILLISCKEAKNQSKLNNVKDQNKNHTEIDTLPDVDNSKDPKTLIKENVIEIYHLFSEKNLAGNPVNVHLENTTGGMLSAYSFDKSDYKLFYREQNGDLWTEWKELLINKEVNNPERKVYAPTNISNKTNSIQFKSSTSIRNEIVFRLYTFPKN